MDGWQSGQHRIDKSNNSIGGEETFSVTHVHVAGTWMTNHYILLQEVNSSTNAQFKENLIYTMMLLLFSYKPGLNWHAETLCKKLWSALRNVSKNSIEK